MSGHRFAPGEARPERCARCGCTEAEAVHAAGGMRTDAGPCYGPGCDHVSHAGISIPERIDRILALSTFDRELLLVYLDGLAPDLVDEWFVQIADTNG